jgi:hypothetical protein
VKLPSSIGGSVTTEVGYFELDSNGLAAWLLDGLGSEWSLRRVPWRSHTDAVLDLRPSVPISRRAVIPSASWSLLMTNGPLGSDVGLLPSQAARQLGCRAIRAVCVEDGEPGYPARILEVYGHDGEPPLYCRRSIVAANDGGRWVFETEGEPFSFEHTEMYRRRRITDRFTSSLLYEYLSKLGAPFDVEPEWANTQIVELAASCEASGGQGGDRSGAVGSVGPAARSVGRRTVGGDSSTPGRGRWSPP